MDSGNLFPFSLASFLSCKVPISKTSAGGQEHSECTGKQIDITYGGSDSRLGVKDTPDP